MLASKFVFRQLFDKTSSTYTYIVGSKKTRECLIIDPVVDQLERDLNLLKQLDLKLTYILDTHVHADHITASGKLRKSTNAKIVLGSGNKIEGVDVLLNDGEVLEMGDVVVQAIHTPGHTSGCTTFKIEEALFTGDTVLIRRTGRTDFQGGSSAQLYKSITQKLWVFADDTVIYPGHDYTGFTTTTVGEEKKWNARVKEGITEEEFVKIMADLKLDYPKQIDVALPANLKLGLE